MKSLTFIVTRLLLMIILAGCSTAQLSSSNRTITNTKAVTNTNVLNHYADIAYATYSDSLDGVKLLHTTLESFVSNPNDTTLETAKQAWLSARIPYMQTEAYRFGNAIVDDWEGKVNAWPLDEGLIDYVDTSYGADSEDNPLYTANVIANPVFKLSGETVDATEITKELLSDTLHEIDGVEANVGTGYHAIEFLLWGQDLNGTNAGAGNRPAADFDTNNCANTNCQRRADYLITASSLLIDDITWMVKQWDTDGDARISLLNDEAAGVTSILTGMGSLSYGEMAGERIKLGVLLHDPEEEHDCFSDNTHNSHYFDIVGIQNVYTGNYTTVRGKQISGPSVSDLVSLTDNAANTELLVRIENSLSAARGLVDSAEKDGVFYDQLLAEGNTSGNAKIMNVVNALLEQTKGIEKAVSVLGMQQLDIEGSDSLDSPSAVFQ